MSPDRQSGIACKTCRRRGRKCDRALPKCISCHRRGVECEGYPLRWVGLAARGHKAGRTHQPVTSDRVPQEQHASARLVVSNAASRVRHMLPQDGLKLFLGYYAHEISTAFYLGPGTATTPYTQYILPMTQNVSSVRYVVAATASCHIGNKMQDDALKTQSLQLRVEATEALRRQLGNGRQEPDISGLACILFLAQLDLCSGGCLEFETHLKAAIEIVKQRGSDGTERGFFQQRLAWLDIMSATTSSRMPLLSSEHVKTALNLTKTPTGRDWGFDVFDCPIDLFEYIADITLLCKLHNSSRKPSGRVLKEAILLGNAARMWNPPANAPKQRRDMFEIWRHGTLLYLIHSFQLSDEVFDTPDLLDRVFQLVDQFSSESIRMFSITWPLFQAGLSLHPEAHVRKDWLRAYFSAHFESRGCAHPKLAIDALEHVWRTGEYYLSNSHTLLCL